MRSIENPDYPLVFKSEPVVALPAPHKEGGDSLTTWTAVQALPGMQKEALVRLGDGDLWRLVSDEGPYLNGTDLAPFPLAFYTVGVAFSFLEELETHSEAAGVELEGLTLTTDHYYTMEGSALRGDMIGGALPIEMVLEAGGGVSEDELRRLLRQAEATSPPQTYMRTALASTFSLTLGQERLAPEKVPACDPGDAFDPGPLFEAARPREGDFLPGIITKVEAAEIHEGEGGVGSSLRAEQRRTLHVRGVTRCLEGGVKEARIFLLHPSGSSFRLLSDGGPHGTGSAPPGPVFLAAGIGFCFMTQLGRYAHITKQPLSAYRIVQENRFHRLGSPELTADPVETHAFLELDAPQEEAQQLLYMGERTCFLHAALRGVNPSRLRAVLGGRELDLG
jgi:hypothetical protein